MIVYPFTLKKSSFGHELCDYLLPSPKATSPVLVLGLSKHAEVYWLILKILRGVTDNLSLSRHKNVFGATPEAGRPLTNIEETFV